MAYTIWCICSTVPWPIPYGVYVIVPLVYQAVTPLYIETEEQLGCPRVMPSARMSILSIERSWAATPHVTRHSPRPSAHNAPLLYATFTSGVDRQLLPFVAQRAGIPTTLPAACLIPCTNGFMSSGYRNSYRNCLGLRLHIGERVRLW